MKNCFAITVGCLLALLAGPGAARAADPKPGEAVVVGEVSLAPIDRVHSALQRGGFGGYRDWFVALVESFPTVGKGVVDTTAPIAIQFVGGDNVPAAGQAMFAFPVGAVMKIVPLH